MISELPSAYLFTHSSEEVLLKSSSGGAFYALATHVLAIGGIVFGAAISPEGTVYHKGVSSIDNLSELMGSKYAMSRMGNVFAEVKEALSFGKQVLFSGTPCQVNALDRFLGGCDRDGLLLVDIICHGCPSPNYWKAYLETLNEKPPYNVSFRDKRVSWERFSLRINGFSQEFDKNYYYYLFLKNYILLESCYSCLAKGENRKSDITLGDAWGWRSYAPETGDSRGTSLVIVRNKRELVQKVFSAAGKLTQTFYWEALRYNSPYFTSVEKPNDRDSVLQIACSPNHIAHCRQDATKPGKGKAHLKAAVARIIDYWPNLKRRSEEIMPQGADIGIITLMGYENCGNKLQNYALLTKLREKGFHPVDVYFSFRFPKGCLRRLIELLARGPNSFEKRLSAFYKHSSKWEGPLFHYKPTVFGAQELSKLKGIIVGSDQVWNPDGPALEYSLGAFLTNGKCPPLFSYAASISKERLGKRTLDYFSNYLPSFLGVSVREQSAKNTLLGAGIKGEVHLDPVFLLSTSQWNEGIKRYARGRPPRKRFLLRYLLSPSSEAEQSIKELEEKQGLSTIDALANDKRIVGPFEFVRLIRDAELVVADSFHALAFSIIYGKKILLWSRSNANDAGMITRLQDLLSLFSLPKEIDTGVVIDCAGITGSRKYIREIAKSNLYLNSMLAQTRGFAPIKTAFPKNPKSFTIVVTVYNCAAYIGHLFQSLFNQTDKDFEIIAACRSSSDGTDEIVEKWGRRFEANGIPCRILKSDDANVCQSINAALPLIQTPFFLSADSDDWYDENLIETLKHHQVKNGSFDIAFIGVRFHEENGEELYERTYDSKRDFDYLKAYISGDEAICFTGIYVIQTNSFRTALPQMRIYENGYGQNWQLLLPLLSQFEPHIIKGTFYNYLIREDSLSFRSARPRKQCELMIQRIIILRTVTQSLGIYDFIGKQYCRTRIRDGLEFSFRNGLRREFVKLYHEQDAPKNARLRIMRVLVAFPLQKGIVRALKTLRKLFSRQRKEA